MKIVPFIFLLLVSSLSFSSLNAQTCNDNLTQATQPANDLNQTVTLPVTCHGTCTQTAVNVDLSNLAGDGPDGTCGGGFYVELRVNGIVEIVSTCGLTNYDISSYIPVTSVALNFDDADGFQDNMTYTLNVDVTYSCGVTPSPGGYSTNLELWLKADAGTTGSPITAWTDQSPAGNNATAGGNPLLISNGINYNPTVDFDGSGDYFSAPADVQTNPNASFIVLKASSSGTGGEGFFSFYDSDSTYDGANAQSLAAFIRRGTGNRIVTRGENTNYGLNIGALDGEYHIHTSTMGNTDVYLYQNSLLKDSNPHIQTLNSDQYMLGCRHWNNTPDKFLNGEIAEIIHYNVQPGATSRNYIETYLAIKYGITLSNSGGGTQGDYNATTGLNIWDADNSASYHNNVIGIGREDVEALYQKQSHTRDDSVRIYVGSLAATNAANTGTIGDLSYALFGDNQGTLSANPTANAEVPGTCGLYSRLGREWKVTKSSFAETISLDVTLSSAANPASVNVNDLVLIVDDDGDFTSGTTACYTTGTGITITYSNPIITISGISTTQIPDDSTVYITIGSLEVGTPLPVTLTSYDISCESDFPALTWVTQSELNNDYFTIERSSNAKDFEKVGTIQGNGTSNLTHHYDWTDKDPLDGTTYYRLKQFDYNGSFQDLGIVAIDCNSANAINIYPNPFGNSLTIDLQGDNHFPCNLEMVDYLGRVVYQQILSNNKVTINLDGKIASGTYFIKLTKHNRHIVERITKIK